MIIALLSLLVNFANAADFEIPVGSSSEQISERYLKYGKTTWIKVSGSSDFSGEIIGCEGPESDTICKWRITFKPTRPGLQTAKVHLHFDFGPYPDDQTWEISGLGIELKPPYVEMCYPGSIIHLESGVLREEIPVVGVPFSLFYSSSLASGFHPNYVKFNGHASYNPETLIPSIHHFLDISKDKLYLGDGTSVDAKFVALKDGTLLVDGAWNRSEVYIFNKSGVHLGTKSRMLGAWLYQFKYDSSGRLSQINYGAGKLTINFVRSATGEFEGIVSAFGQKTTIESEGRLVKAVENPMGERYDLRYGKDELLREFVNPLRQTSVFLYAENGLLISDVNSGGNSTSIERTFSGTQSSIQVKSALGPRSSIKGGPTIFYGKPAYQSVSLDPLGITTTVTQVGTAIRTDYDGSSNMVDYLEDPRTKAMRQSWTAQAHGGAGWYSVGKWFNSEPKAVSDPFSYNTFKTTFYEVINNETTTLGSSFFDAKKRTFTNISKEGVKTVTTYDSFERPISVKAGDDVATEFSYDSFGRILSLNRKDTPLLQFKYDQSNNLVEILNSVGAKKAFEYDGASRITKVTQQDGSAVTFGYDKSGNLTSIVPANKEKYEFVHNGMGLIGSFLPPLFKDADPTAIHYEYDLEKRITKIVRPNSSIISFSYDVAGKLLTASTAEGYYENMFFSNSPALYWSRTPDGIIQEFKYLGTLVSEKTQTEDGSPKLQVKYSYDEKYRVKRFESIVDVDAWGYDVSYNFDSKVVKAGEEVLTWGVPSGRLLKRTLDNIVELRKYDEFGELKSIETQLIGKVKKTIFLSVMTRDKLGRIIKKEDSVNGLKEVFEYSYDLMGRLVATKRSGQDFSRYKYDANGNRIGGVHAGLAFTASFDQEDRMVMFNSERYSYDGEGNTFSVSGAKGETQLKYTSFGKLSEVVSPAGVIRYKIDPSGIPVVREEGESKENSIFFENSKLAALIDGKSNVTRFVHAAGILTPDYLVKGTQRYFVVRDHLGSPRLLVDSKTGIVVQELAYSDLGLVLKNSNPGFQPFGYAGGFLDRSTGLVRFGARHYDPRIGRWISKDPILFLGGDTNLYGYVMSDPINFIDPTGLAWEDVSWSNVAGGIAQVGFGYGAVVGGAAMIGTGAGTPLGIIGTAIGAGGIISGFALLGIELDKYKNGPFGSLDKKDGGNVCSMK